MDTFRRRDYLSLETFPINANLLHSFLPTLWILDNNMVFSSAETPLHMIFFGSMWQARVYPKSIVLGSDP